MVMIKGETSVDFGGSFKIPTPGEHIMMFLEEPLGIEVNDDSQERFVCQLEVIDDPAEDENGAEIRMSFPLEWENIEERVCNILTCAGVASDIETTINDKYPDNNFTVFSDEVVEQIQLKLPGCAVKCITSVRKHNDRTYGQIDHMEIINSQPARSTSSSQRKTTGNTSTGSRRRTR